jgi:uncharacterized protein
LVSAAFFEELGTWGPPVEAVYGNQDEPALQQSLPLERVVEVEGARVGMVHIPGLAAGRSARLRARFPGCDAIVYGHTHLPEVSRDDGVWILNPGSPTERRRAPTRAMLVLTVDGSAIRPQAVDLSPAG